MFKKLASNPYILFLPFLIYYTYLIIKNKWPSLYGDEIRYTDFAKNLLHGYYSPSPPHINLWNGPGYPIILMPFEALHIADIYPTLLNALFLYLAIVLLFKALRLFANFKTALFFSLLLAVYPNAQAMLPILYTEAFTYFLVALFIDCLCLCYGQGRYKYIIAAGLVLGFLTLTKIIFGYVLILSLAICLAALLFKKSKAYRLKAVIVLALAFATTLPYLVYTYSVTGKVFYWGNSGGMSLYWMSTPYAHEYGDWKLPNLSNKQYPMLFKSAETVAILKKNHSAELSFILKHNELQQDSLFKQIAISNIKKTPSKFIRNYISNFSRMLFNFPYSYAYQDSAIIGNIVIGSAILWACLAGAVLTLYNWRRVGFAIKLLLLLTAVYLILSGALSSYPRQFDVILPVLLFWLGYLWANIPKPGFRFLGGEN